ncbi:MAG: alpha/beta fold hydrolase [Proteobacteria bacterium]|nr:alpha/beta fold hydrolase [Pseudomonadota bacterium]
MTDSVVLLHGLWLRGGAMAFLQRRLRVAGFSPLVFDYASVHEGIEAAATRLHKLVQGLDGKVHLVGHSLGGVLATLAVQRDPTLIDGRIVCLGSPLRGSSAARSLARFPGGTSLLGGSRELLERGLERWDGPQQIGVIAGRLPLGLGWMLGGLHLPHDGSVAVAETRLPGLADHRVIAAAHTGLVYSEQAAIYTGAFLREGRFAA